MYTDARPLGSRRVQPRRSAFVAGVGAAALLGILVSGVATGLRAQDGSQDRIRDGNGDPGSLMREARTHVAHIMEEWPEAPEGQGLLELAVAEAQAVARHATLATRAPHDLDAMKVHAAHALRALDPSRAEAGEAGRADEAGAGASIPDDVGLGEGYGFRRAASEIAREARLADAAPGATPGIRSHAEVVTVSAENATGWAGEMIPVAEKIRSADAAPEAAALAARLKELSTRLVSGHDLNGDEEILWQDGEGGLMHVQMHMSLMTRVDGRWYFRDRGTGPAPEPQR